MTKPRVTVTLGTLEDLGLNGRLLDDVAAVLKGWKHLDRRRCLGCRFPLSATVGDGSVPVRARILDADDPLTHCDHCWPKSIVSHAKAARLPSAARTAAAGAILSEGGERPPNTMDTADGEDAVPHTEPCYLFPDANVYHEDCGGKFCAHNVCQECGAHLEGCDVVDGSAPGELAPSGGGMDLRFCFLDLQDRTGQSIYNTEEGLRLRLGDFHSGSTFRGTIEVDDKDELRDALAGGFQPVFVALAATAPRIPGEETV